MDVKKKHYIFGKQSSHKLTDSFDIEVLGELPISHNLIRDYDSEHPILKQEQNDVIFRSFFDICQKVLNKIKA